ncbi:hypothetical protein ABT272_43220 [Streptomyces sp900105245]|uniref:Uncharacterized protein n=1 Tax=Streptomyces sp. 900105245 TaxID=3154379 RepID=A0ABV1UKZ1_9ACTN
MRFDEFLCPGLFAAGVRVRQSDLGRCDCLAGAVAPESEMAVVEEHFHVREVLEADGKALRAAVASCIRPGRIAPERATLAISNDDCLSTVCCLFFPETNARRPPRLARGPADLDFSRVQTQFDALGLGVDEHVRQGQPSQARTVRNRAASFGQKARTSPTARVTVERPTPNMRAKTTAGGRGRK